MNQAALDSLEHIAKQVCARHGYKLEQIKVPQRFRRITKVRLACYYKQRMAGYTYQEIGDWWGKNHTTIIYGVRRHREQMKYGMV